MVGVYCFSINDVDAFGEEMSTQKVTSYEKVHILQDAYAYYFIRFLTVYISVFSREMAVKVSPLFKDWLLT